MAAFIRRYGSEPTEAELLKIEGVVVIDAKPIAQVRGIGTGTVMCTGEFEDGPFAADEGPVEVFGDADFGARFGGFGFTYSGIAAQHPCCRSRNADGAVLDELWNGNGFVQLRSGRFSRLFLARVDTSVGSVEFNRLASLAGNTNPSWDLEPGWILVLSIDGAGNVTVTWDAAAAVIVSGAGTYPWAPVGGETIVFKVDGTQYTATFLATDTSQALTIARLNAAAGSTRFTNAGPGVDDTTFTGIIRGTGGSVQIVSGSAAALAATGFVAGAAVPGTGDVANIDLVSDAEVRTRIEADAPGASSDRDSSGRLRVFSTTDDGTGTIEVDTTSTANAAFGFAVETEATAAAGVAGTIPAGTRVNASVGGQLFVTMQTVNVAAANPGPYSVKVRHATDDQTGTQQLANTINTVFAPIQLGAFSVSNPITVTAALTDAQIDTRYSTALAKTVGQKGKQINVSFSARQSNAVRAALRQNAIDASANGCFGRVALIRPPLGTTRAVARGSAQPGVGAYRSDRVVYCFPGVQKLIPEIAAIGTAGGTGFTDDGILNVGFDMAVATLCSNLNPEENIGQETEFIGFVLGIESGNADVADLTLDDYAAFKAAGICAPRIDEGVTAQSGVTSVDPALFPALAPLNRRRFSDFYQDSVARFAGPFVKKLATATLRAILVARFNSFIVSLGERIEQSQSQCFGDAKIAGNTPESLARNVFRTKHFVRMTPTMDVIVIDTLIGNDVTIEETA